MSTRKQNAATSELPENIEAVLERQIKQEKNRAEYNQRPEVKARRAEYQKKQQRLRGIARAAIKGDVEKLTGEYEFSAEAAAALVAKAGEKVEESAS